MCHRTIIALVHFVAPEELIASISEAFDDWVSALPVSSIGVTLILDVGAVAVIAWIWLRRRRGNRWATWPYPVAVVLLFLAALSAANNEFGYINTLGALFDTADYATGPAQLISATEGRYVDGVVIPELIPGAVSGIGPQIAYVYLPPQYFDGTAQRFRVAYLLAGTPGSALDWFRGGGAADAGATSARNNQPMIIVSPTVGPDLLADTECVNGAQGRWEDYLAIDVPNWVNAQARTVVGKAGQAIAGLSMGGYCAQMLALRHPASFAASGNFSGYTVPTYDPGLPALFGDPPNLTAIVNSYSCDWLITNQPASRPVSNWLAVGAQDDPVIAAEQEQFTKLATGLGVAATYSELSGSHTFYLWGTFLSEWLPWANEVLDRAQPKPTNDH